MVAFTVVFAPLVPHDEPVMPLGDGDGLGVGVGEGDGVGLGDGVGDGDGDGVGLPLGTEHSLTALSGAGSDPKVDTVQVKLPFKVLKTNLPAAPNATLVDWGTEQVSGILQIVVYPSGRFVAAKAAEATSSNEPPQIACRT